MQQTIKLLSFTSSVICHDANNNITQALPNEDTDKNGVVTWEEYVINTFGEQYLTKVDDKDGDDDDDDDDDDKDTYIKSAHVIVENCDSIFKNGIYFYTSF